MSVRNETSRSPTAHSSTLAITEVRHRRHRPAVHRIRLTTFHVLVDVDDLPRLDREVLGFGHNRRSPIAVHDRDHLGGPDGVTSRAAAGPETLRQRMEALLSEREVVLPGGSLLLLCHPRVFGHVFNPVSWWFAHHEDDTLGLIVAEVSNTFGDRVVYVLDELESGPDGTVRSTTAKRLHVSPFLPVDDHVYRFVVRPPGPTPAARVLVHMEVDDPEGTVLDATQDGRLVPFTTARLIGLLLRFPLVSLRSLAHIHLHALMLWRKRVPFHRRPAPPADAVRVRRRSAVRFGSGERDEH
jgi:uncharacterized protein